MFANQDPIPVSVPISSEQAFETLVNGDLNLGLIDSHQNAPLRYLYTESRKQSSGHWESISILSAVADTPHLFSDMSGHRPLATSDTLVKRCVGLARLARTILEYEASIEGVLFHGSVLRVRDDLVRDIDCAVLLPFSGPAFYDLHEATLNAEEARVAARLKLLSPEEAFSSQFELSTNTLHITVHAQCSAENRSDFITHLLKSPILVFVRGHDRMGVFMNNAGRGFMDYKT